MCQMIPLLVFLSSVTITPVEQKYNEYLQMQATTLAPFPLYFTPQGAPAAQVFHIYGKVFACVWDGKEVEIREITEGPHIEDGTYSYSSFERMEREDRERQDPLIIKFKKAAYLIYYKGDIKFKEVTQSGERLWDSIFNIKPPNGPPENFDSSNWEPDPSPTPSRFKWKPEKGD